MKLRKKGKGRGLNISRTYDCYTNVVLLLEENPSAIIAESCTEEGCQFKNESNEVVFDTLFLLLGRNRSIIPFTNVPAQKLC